MLHAIIGLGANLGDGSSTFAAVLNDLRTDAEVVAVSRLWHTRPVGPEQPDYLNAAALVRWTNGPGGLLARCQKLETAAGRDRDAELRWGPRTLDLDLLIFEDLVWRGPELEVPHPRFHERAFALVPAAEVAPGWVHPLLGHTLADLAGEARRADPDALLSSEPFPS